MTYCDYIFSKEMEEKKVKMHIVSCSRPSIFFTSHRKYNKTKPHGELPNLKARLLARRREDLSPSTKQNTFHHQQLCPASKV